MMTSSLTRQDSSGDTGTGGGGPRWRILSERLPGDGWSSRALLALLAFGIFAAYLADEHSAAGALGFSSDDAWIHFRFAQNLISGNGFSYNVGQPVAGSTAPLWTLVCTVFLGVFRDPVWAGKLAGFVFWVLLLWGVFRLVMDLTGSKLAAWGGALLTLLHQRVVWGALSGLEVMLYSALVIWALVLHFRSTDDPQRSYWPVTVLLVLAGLTRPELFALVPLFWLDHWWLSWRPDSPAVSRWRQVGISVGVGAALLAPYLAFNYWTIGKPMPLTFYAKVSSTGLWAALAAGDFGRIVAAILGDGPQYLIRTWTLFLFSELPGTIGCWILWWKLRGLPHAVRGKIRLLLAVPLYYLLISAVFTSGIQGAFGRYLTFLFPLLSVIAVVATWHWLHDHLRSSRALVIASALLAAIFGIPIVATVVALSPVRSFWLGIYPLVHALPDAIGRAITDDQIRAGQAIAFRLAPFLAGIFGLVWAAHRLKGRRWIAGSLWGVWMVAAVYGMFTWAPICSMAVKNINDLNVATGQWLDTNLPPNATIAVNDIGAIGFFAGRRHIYDLMGLVESDILPYRQRGDDGIWEYLTLKRPDYLAIFDTWFPKVVLHTDVLEKVHSIHAEDYMLWGYHTISIYRAHWERIDTRSR